MQSASGCPGDGRWPNAGPASVSDAPPDARLQYKVADQPMRRNAANAWACGAQKGRQETARELRPVYKDRASAARHHNSPRRRARRLIALTVRHCRLIRPRVRRAGL
jgi:hypothetical protein